MLVLKFGLSLLERGFSQIQEVAGVLSLVIFTFTFAPIHNAHRYKGSGACPGRSRRLVDCGYKLILASAPTSGELNKASSEY
jgi:hypothetical protein